MTTPHIICEQDVINTLEATASRFFEDVLGMDYAPLVTDESDLSDFSFSGGMPADTMSSTLREKYEAWDAWVIDRINTRYGVALTTTRIKMVLLLSQIDASFNRTIQ